MITLVAIWTYPGMRMRHNVKSSVMAKIRIKMVADTSDKTTRNYLAKLWDGASASQKKKLLDKRGFSHKYVMLDFKDLTPAIQESIVTKSIWI